MTFHTVIDFICAAILIFAAIKLHRAKKDCREWQIICTQMGDLLTTRGAKIEQVQRMIDEAIALAKKASSDRQYHVDQINHLAKAIGTLGMTSEQVVIAAIQQKEALLITQRTIRGTFADGYAIHVTGHEMRFIQSALGITVPSEPVNKPEMKISGQCARCRKPIGVCQCNRQTLEQMRDGAADQLKTMMAVLPKAPAISIDSTPNQTITVHDGNGNNPRTLNRMEYDALVASGMMWEFHPDAPHQWPFQ